MEEDSILPFGGTIPKDSPANVEINKLVGDAIIVTLTIPKDLLVNAETSRVIGDA